MRRRDEAADESEPPHPPYRRGEIQDLRLRLGHRQLLARYRMGEGQDGRRSSRNQEHRHRARAVASSGEDPLLGAGESAYQGRAMELEKKTGRRQSKAG